MKLTVLVFTVNFLKLLILKDYFTCSGSFNEELLTISVATNSE